MPQQNENRQDDAVVGYPVDFLLYKQNPAYGPSCDDPAKKPFKHKYLLCFLCFFTLFLIASSAVVAFWLHFTSNIPAPTIRVTSVSTVSRNRSTAGWTSLTFFVRDPDRFSIVGFKKVKVAIVNGDMNRFHPVMTGYLMRDGDGGSYLDVKAEGYTVTAAKRGGLKFWLELQATVLMGFGYVLQFEQWQALTASCGNLTVGFPVSVLLAVGELRGAKCTVRVS